MTERAGSFGLVTMGRDLDLSFCMTAELCSG